MVIIFIKLLVTIIPSGIVHCSFSSAIVINVRLTYCLSDETIIPIICNSFYTLNLGWWLLNIDSN